MPLTCTVGLQKKAGLPEYGSVGASCNVQFELDGTLLQTDLDAFQQHVHNAYVACSQAVTEELARQQSGQSNGSQTPASQSAGRQGSNGNNGHRASQKQLDYLNQLARQVNGLGVRRLESLAQKLNGKPLADLTSLEASSLIDTVKAIKEGRLDLEASLNGSKT